MNNSVPPPPTYEEVQKTSNPNWKAWYRKLIGLDFNLDESVEYAKLFVDNEVEMNMIPELSDDILRGIGIEKAGHRIRILRLQRQNPIQTPQLVAVTNPQSFINSPRCVWHPNTVAIEKCYLCNRLLCLHCRRKEENYQRVRYYCKDCHEACIIL